MGRSRIGDESDGSGGRKGRRGEWWRESHCRKLDRAIWVL